jgi:ankyrin repeat protein
LQQETCIQLFVHKQGRAGKDTLCAMAVQAAAQDGADVNTRPEAAAGVQPRPRWLSATSGEGLEETVRALVEAGAEVDQADNMGRTALYAAAERGHAM